VAVHVSVCVGSIVIGARNSALSSLLLPLLAEVSE
jgi:hypothetical protein